MAVLSADHAGFSVDGEAHFLILPLRQATAGDIYYRGGLTWDSATGIIITGAGDASIFRGVVAERTTVVAANDRVRCYIYGHFLFAFGAAASIANEGLWPLRGTTADQDNPATLVTTAPGAGINGAVGMLTTVETAGTDGWVLVNANLRDSM
jgi:hypothetical protein